MTELFHFLADSGLSMRTEYVDGDLVVVLTKIDTDFYCAFTPGVVRNHSELFTEFFYPARDSLNQATS